ncbi:MAG TPA: hypothetical protein VF989_14580 [Polyangiaceae bacterium]|jgi:hypothetical protein
MHPAVRATVLVAVLALVAQGAELLRRRESAAAATPSPAERQSDAPCPPDTLPDGRVCIPVPPASADLLPSLPYTVRDYLPRRPDRLADLSRYALPFPNRPGATSIRVQASKVGALGFTSSQPEPIMLVELDGQRGPARVLDVSTKDGQARALTRHLVELGRRAREILLVWDGLQPVSGELRHGLEMPAGKRLGSARSLELLTRQVREGVDGKSLDLTTALDDDKTIATDPRNVLVPRKR